MDDEAEVLHLVRPGATPPEDELPSPDDEYVACGRTSNKPEIMLCLILRNQSYELFSYGSLVRARLTAAAMSEDGRALCLRFLGAGVTDVTLEGRNLLDLIHDLRRHRIPWLREVPTDRPLWDRNITVITRIRIGHAQGEW